MPLEVSTAENVSNLTWLVFAAISLLLWKYRLLPHLGSRARRSLCALLCVLLMMFPIISISDDLHPDMVAAVEGESKSRLIKSADPSRAAACHTAELTLWAGGAASQIVLPVLVILERVISVATPTLSSAETIAAGPRAPPAPPHA